MEIKTVDLKQYSSLRVGGEGKLVEVTSTVELVEVIMYAQKEGLRIHILGEGTNTFFADSLENFLIVRMLSRGISFEEHGDSIFVTAFAGESWDDVVQFSVEKGLWGLENLSYIPGTVGAAPVQNIGAYGVELADVFVSLSALDRETLNVVEIDKGACNFGYRDSLFKQQSNRYIILSVKLELSKKPRAVLTYKPLDSLLVKETITSYDVRELVVATRMTKLPNYATHPNTGSFFKNPVVTTEEGVRLRGKYENIPLIEVVGGYKIPAAWLIEHVAEMKGVRMGNVGTWPSQPLVIVNYGEADAEEVMAFSGEIIKKIKEATGVELEREVNFVM